MRANQERFLEKLLATIIRHNVTVEVNDWLHEKAAQIRNEQMATQLNLAFAAVPRKTGKKVVEVTKEEQADLATVHAYFTMSDWMIDRLCRVWLLLQVEPPDKENYFKKLENLFLAAEMNELVALYSALPGLHFQEDWQKQCAEGIRSNIGIVLEAIMYNNPYPYKYLNEQAWNQLVLKAFFTDKDVKRIIGLDERANKELAAILIDYASERWAAQRIVNPQLWRLITKFIDGNNFSSIQKAFSSLNLLEKKAAALAALNSNFQPAKELIDSAPDLKLAIIENKLNWDSL